MILTHFYRANLSPGQLRHMDDEAEVLYTDVAPHEIAHFLEIDGSDTNPAGLDRVMSVHRDELRREHGFFINV